VLLLAHTGIGSAVNALRDRLVTHCAGSVEPGASHPFNSVEVSWTWVGVVFGSVGIAVDVKLKVRLEAQETCRIYPNF